MFVLLQTIEETLAGKQKEALEALREELNEQHQQEITNREHDITEQLQKEV